MAPATATALVGSLGGESRLVGVQQRDFSRDLFGKGDEIMGLYNPRVGLRREEDSRGGQSFVAYVGGDANIHAGCRQEDVGARGGMPVVGGNSLALVSAARRWENQERKTLEDETWSTTATSGGRTLKEEEHGKQKVDTGLVACLDVVPYTDGNEGPESQTEDTDEEEHLQLQFHQLGERSKRAQGSVSTNCRDCGNQAKKDCHHQRCRTCCRSRGFTCPTHVKSTWVPAAKRREKHGACGTLRPRAKRVRSGVAETDALNGATSLTPTSAGTSPRDSEINSVNPTHQVLPSSASAAVRDECSTENLKGNLPSEVRAQAVFKCVRVTGIADEHNEFAYQATVKIGGRVFKGVLYDQGPDNGINRTNASDLQLGDKSVPSASSPINPMGLYGTAGGGHLLGNVL